MSDIGPISDHIWFLQAKSGELVSISEELDKLLHEENWHALSATSTAGHLSLILTSLNDNKIDRIIEVELDQQANIHCLK